MNKQSHHFCDVILTQVIFIGQKKQPKCTYQCGQLRREANY